MCAKIIGVSVFLFLVEDVELEGDRKGEEKREVENKEYIKKREEGLEKYRTN